MVSSFEIPTARFESELVYDPNSFYFGRTIQKEEENILVNFEKWKIHFSLRLKYSFLMIEGMKLDDNFMNSVL